MPIYEYVCPKCQKRYEIQHRIDDHDPRSCLDCVTELRRVFRIAGISFKGDGWGKDAR